MLISDLRDLISAIPICQHSVDINRVNWNNDNQVFLIQHFFGNNAVITLSRNDLFQTNCTTELVIKTLMWGDIQQEEEEIISSDYWKRIIFRN